MRLRTGPILAIAFGILIALTGQATSIYTVVTNKAGELVTAFPGRPTR